MKELAEATQYSPAIKKKILVSVLLGLTMSNMMINNVVIILPPFVSKKEWDTSTGESLADSDTSLIIAIFAIA